MNEFQRSLAKVLVHEGGWSNNPKDPGGATMKGVTQAVYDVYRKTHGLPVTSVRGITTSELETIYKAQYWDLFKGDRMPAGVSYVVFDGAVNSGVSQSVKWLQRALGQSYKGAVDGLVGEGTLTALDANANHDALIADICRRRLAFMKTLDNWPTFGGGWQLRVNGVLLTGQAWATGGVDSSAVHLTGPIAEQAGAKALAEDVVDAPAKAPGDVAAGGGGALALLSQTAAQLQQFAANPSVQQILLWLTIAGIVLAVGGYAYREWAKRKAARIKVATA